MNEAEQKISLLVGKDDDLELTSFKDAIENSMDTQQAV